MADQLPIRTSSLWLLFENPAPVSSCRCRIKEILLYMFKILLFANVPENALV
jgi:hypothetical protein